jgi:hypothetical protein
MDGGRGGGSNDGHRRVYEERGRWRRVVVERERRGS